MATLKLAAGACGQALRAAGSRSFAAAAAAAPERKVAVLGAAGGIGQPLRCGARARGATRVARAEGRVGGRFRLRRPPRGGLGAVRRALTGGPAREEGIYSFPRSSAALRRPRGPTAAAATSSLTRRAPAPARPRCRLAAC